MKRPTAISLAGYLLGFLVGVALVIWLFAQLMPDIGPAG